MGSGETQFTGTNESTASAAKAAHVQGSNEGAVANYATTNNPTEFTGANEATAAAAAANAYSSEAVRINQPVRNKSN